MIGLVVYILIVGERGAAGKIQKQYDLSKEEAERQMSDWVART